MSIDKNVLLEVKNLKKYFPVKGGLLSRTVDFVKAVDGISFNVYKGETLGLVGESGCGKTTTARTILRLEDATDGEVIYQGRDIAKLSRKGMRPLRKQIQIIYQDPYSSLNPRMTVGQIVGEPLFVNGMARGQALEKRVQELLEAVGLSRFQSRRYPHEFSGGQRQRIGIARALAVNPEIIFCDEPVSALDMSIQSQILNLFAELKKEFDLTYVFIAHDMSTVKHASDRVGVMYLGKLVELTDKRTIFADPQHPYTQALMSAIPIPDPDLVRDEIVLEGDVPSPINPPSGCRFHTRCPVVIDKCNKEDPEYKDVGGGHFVACHLR